MLRAYNSQSGQNASVYLSTHEALDQFSVKMNEYF